MPTGTHELTVSRIMSLDVIAVRPDQAIREALELMISHRLSALPVISDDDDCVGMLSARDLIELAYALDKELKQGGPVDQAWVSLLDWEDISATLGQQLVSEVMTVDYHSLPPTAMCRDAARVMVQAGVHRLPIIDPTNGRVAGIVSTTDIVRAVADQDNE